MTAQARYDLNKPYRWVAIAVVSCLAVGGGSYYAGMTSHHRMTEYQLAKSNEANWSDFVRHWQNASEAEKAVIERMMTRR